MNVAKVKTMDFGKTIIGFAAVLAVMTGCGLSQEDKLPVVRVGKSVITKGDLDIELSRYVDEDHGETNEEVYNLKKNILEQLIEEYLIVEDAKKRGIKITDEELAEEVAVLSAKEGEEALKKSVSDRYGSYGKWKDVVRRRLLINKTEELVVKAGVEISDSQVKKYYDANKKDFKVGKSVHLFMIVVDTEELAKELREKITVENFSDIASRHSIGAEKETGGDLGYFTQGEMPPEIEDSAFVLAINKVSSVIKSPYGYHILLVKDKKRATTQKFKDVKGSIKEILKREESDMLFTKWLYELKQETRIEIYEENL